MDDKQFRTAMGKFATGVTVIATEVEGEVHGMTANAFMSVSLDQKLIVISVRKQASILAKLQSSQTFSVNILGEDQQEVSMIFAGQLKDKQVDFNRLDGKPVIPGSIAQIACEVSGEHIEGDHILFIGKVTDIYVEDKAPLIYYNGKYGSLKEEMID
ncbi:MULTISPECIES: flavin reductase family protein [unclassified Niallia]|uniref:flavin reductase family protein n=1 Tax=unclassified Niallia TaxID=2837522 RepID=UPI001EDBDA4F|nr:MULTISPECIES: flavin reductase family protein [unclassified Niallia]MDL0434365.1 flavin reductase family protein [Niallia sp. SS-2023]UPO89109.1 flavin reductase family protein [Niallia sp. Man26]